jgi:ribonuclease HI
MYYKTDSDFRTLSDNKMKVVVFTDGACENNGKKGARASWGVWFPDHKDFSEAQVIPADQQQTNQRGELMAISKAVQIIEKNFPYDTDIQIMTDSDYSKNCLTKWLPSWISKNWKTSTNKDVCHRDLIEDTSTRLSKFNSFLIIHVDAHTGGTDYNSVNNAIVDRMATKVLNPEAEVKVITTNTQVAIEGMPLTLMGPPIADSAIHTWCRTNLDKMDKTAVDAALVSALSKTLKKKGFELVKHKLSRTTEYRLVSANHLISEGTTIIKEE